MDMMEEMLKDELQSATDIAEQRDALKKYSDYVDVKPYLTDILNSSDNKPFEIGFETIRKDPKEHVIQYKLNGDIFIFSKKAEEQKYQ